MRPKENKGWFKKGEEHPDAKLTKEDVLEIRRLYFKEGLTQQEISEKYNVRQAHISKIICGIRWSCV